MVDRRGHSDSEPGLLALVPQGILLLLSLFWNSGVAPGDGVGVMSGDDKAAVDATSSHRGEGDSGSSARMESRGSCGGWSVVCSDIGVDSAKQGNCPCYLRSQVTCVHRHHCCFSSLATYREAECWTPSKEVAISPGADMLEDQMSPSFPVLHRCLTLQSRVSRFHSFCWMALRLGLSTMTHKCTYDGRFKWRGFCLGILRDST